MESAEQIMSEGADYVEFRLDGVSRRIVRNIKPLEAQLGSAEKPEGS
jgi:hypothetical protein